MKTHLAMAAALLLAQPCGCGGSDKADDDADAGDTATDTADAGDATAEAPWDVEPPEGNCPEGWTCRSHGLPPFNGVDILVVVDDSASMSEEQENMIDQFPGLIEDLLWPLLSPYTGKPYSSPINDLHLGVISTDMGTDGYDVDGCDFPLTGKDGILQSSSSGLAGCEPSYPDYLAYDEDAPVPDEVEWMGKSFSCIAALGTGGCGVEQQLEAALKALTENSETGGPNEGFLRDDTVLVVLWLSDEDDCSVEDTSLLDPDDASLPHFNLRCYETALRDRLHGVSRYVDGLTALREGTPWPVILSMIVGVPPDETLCNGYGDELDGCLDVTLMEYSATVTDTGTPIPYQSCITSNGWAFPPRRFVELAQEFGHAAYVHSICQDDYSPALDAVASQLSAIADRSCEGIGIQLEKDPADGCACTTECRVVHVLDGTGSCPAAMEEWDADGDGTAEEILDGDGDPATACEVPYAGTVVGDCDRLCHDPLQAYSADGEGWYYTLEGDGAACPSVAFTAGMGTPAGGYTFVACPG